MKVIIAGSRSISNIEYIYQAVKDSNFNITEVVSGTARGIDILGEIYAKKEGLSLSYFPADWNNIDTPGAIIKFNAYGKYNAIAGHQRNEKMGNYADALIAVWDGKSSGTKHMIKYMKSLGKPVFVFNTNKLLIIGA